MSFYIQTHCPKEWKAFFNSVSNVLQHIDQKLEGEILSPTVEKRFSPFFYCNPRDIKVVILGQDPYPNPNHACGLSFSTGTSEVPPSLKNIYRTMKEKIPGFNIPNHGDLSWWASQGVFMINSAWTIPYNGKSNAHKDIWINFTRRLLEYIMKENENIVFMLWGRASQSFIKHAKNHLLLKCNHPSPLAYNRNEFSPQNFRHMNHFNEANEYLIKNRKTFINWCLPNFFNHKDNILCYDIETSAINLFNAKDDEEFKELSNGRKVRLKNQTIITSIAWIFNGVMKKACYHFGKYAIYDQLDTFEDFVEDMKKAKMVITYNGKQFDEPFIEYYFDLKPHTHHFDIRKVSSERLKDLAKIWGLNRSSGQVDGGLAVRLWKRWVNESEDKVLKTMINYNIDDTFETYKIYCLINGIKCPKIELGKL